MDKIYDMLISVLATIVDWLQMIPVAKNVSMFEFLVAMIIMSTIIFGLIPIVSHGGSDTADRTIKNERAERQRIENSKNRRSK